MRPKRYRALEFSYRVGAKVSQRALVWRASTIRAANETKLSEHSAQLKRRVLIIVALAGLITPPLALWLLQADPKLELKLVRQTLENGGPVAYFRLQGCEGRRIQIGEIEQLSPHCIIQWADLLAVFRDPRTAGLRELRLAIPPEVPIWKLRITVHTEQPSLVERFKTARRQWQTLRSMKYSVAEILREIWSTPTFIGSRGIESGWITNSVPIVQAQNR